MNKKEKIQILQDLIQIQSVNTNEKEVAVYLKDLLSKYGIQSELITYDENRSNLVFEIQGQKDKDTDQTLAFSGHFDVVGVDEDAWSYPPFAAEIHEEYMYGRGTADMKAGVAALIIAMIELYEAGAPFSGTLRFLGSVGEEVGMFGSHQLTKAGYTKDVDALLIAEPSGKDIIFAHKGSLMYEVISTGKAAHSSMPDKGINALTQIAEFIQKAEKRLNEKTEEITNQQLGPMTNSFTVIQGGEQINSIPAKVSLLGNARTIPEFDQDKVIDVLNSVIEEVNQEIDGEIELNIMHKIAPVESTPDSKIIQSIKKATNKDLMTTTFAGATDASNYLNIDREIELAIYSNFDLTQAHTVDEKIKVDDYLELIDVYKKVAQNYLS